MDLGSDVDHCGILTAIVQVAIDVHDGYKARMSSPPAQDNNWSLIQQPLISGGWYTQEVNVVCWIWDQFRMILKCQAPSFKLDRSWIMDYKGDRKE